MDAVCKGSWALGTACGQCRGCVEELKTMLAAERASHCVCKCDDEGEFIVQCFAHKTVEEERDRLRAALRNLTDHHKAMAGPKAHHLGCDCGGSNDGVHSCLTLEEAFAAANRLDATLGRQQSVHGERF